MGGHIILDQEPAQIINHVLKKTIRLGDWGCTTYRSFCIMSVSLIFRHYTIQRVFHICSKARVFRHSLFFPLGFLLFPPRIICHSPYLFLRLDQRFHSLISKRLCVELQSNNHGSLHSMKLGSTATSPLTK